MTAELTLGALTGAVPAGLAAFALTYITSPTVQWRRDVKAFLERLGFDISVRQVQRIGQGEGNRKLRHSGRLEKGEWGSSFKFIVYRLMIDRGDDPNLCALCGDWNDKPMTIHHTKYEGATLDDLVFARMNCQNKFESKGLA